MLSAIIRLIRLRVRAYNEIGPIFAGFRNRPMSLTKQTRLSPFLGIVLGSLDAL